LALEGFESAVPLGTHFGEPSGRPTEPAWDHPVTDLPAMALCVEQPGRGQSAEVLDHGLPGHRIAGCQFGRGQRALSGQLVEQAPAGRVGQGGEYGVDRRLAPRARLVRS